MPVPPDAWAWNATRSGASPARGVAVQARARGPRLGPGAGVGVVAGGWVTGGGTGAGGVWGVGGLLAGGGESSPRVAAKATPPPAAATATPPTRSGDTPADATKPDGTDGNTVTGALGRLGATTFSRHSSAPRTTMGSYSWVWAEPD